MPSTFNEPSAKPLLLGQFFQKFPKESFIGSQPQKTIRLSFKQKEKMLQPHYTNDPKKETKTLPGGHQFAARFV
jgi:hypothetical protein